MLQVYKDDNHKPEMTVAISDFEALCGFVSDGELTHVINTYPELHPCLGATSSSSPRPNDENASPNTPPDSADWQKQKLKRSFTALMTCESSKVYTLYRLHALPKNASQSWLIFSTAESKHIVQNRSARRIADMLKLDA